MAVKEVPATSKHWVFSCDICGHEERSQSNVTPEKFTEVLGHSLCLPCMDSVEEFIKDSIRRAVSENLVKDISV